VLIHFEAFWRRFRRISAVSRFSHIVVMRFEQSQLVIGFHLSEIDQRNGFECGNPSD
jgi:hypothetical protein